MLFDHGCDAINAGVVSVSVACMFGTGWTIQMFLCQFVGFVPFYIQTWEEFYIGSMILPTFNGPSDGLFTLTCLSFLSGIVGSQFWQTVSYV